VRAGLSMLLCRLASRHAARHRYGPALTLLDFSSALLQPAAAQSAHVVATILGWQAVVYRLMGGYGTAARLRREAIGRADAGGSDRASLMIWLLNSLRMVGKYAGWFDEARDAYARALCLAESQPTRDLHTLANLYHNLGGLAHARGMSS